MCHLSDARAATLWVLAPPFYVFYFLLDTRLFAPTFLIVGSTLFPAVLLLPKCFQLRSQIRKLVWTVTKVMDGRFQVRASSIFQSQEYDTPLLFLGYEFSLSG